jgi:hypothetical protein
MAETKLAGRLRRGWPTWDGSSPGEAVLPSAAANRISRPVPWHITEIRPDLSGNKFAIDLSATLFLSCFRCTFLHRVACSNSLLNNSKRAQQSFSVVRPAAVRIPPSPPFYPYHEPRDTGLKLRNSLRGMDEREGCFNGDEISSRFGFAANGQKSSRNPRISSAVKILRVNFPRFLR